MAPDRPPIDLLLDTTVEAAVEEGDETFVEQVLRRGVEALRDDLPLRARAVYLSLVLTDDAGIAAINRAYRRIDAPTDVLSFPQHEDVRAVDLQASGKGAPLMLGDIVVSVPRAEEQAREYGHTRAREFGFLLVHGLLHLLGYDHEIAGDAAAMEARQDAVLDTLGLHRDPSDA